MPRVIVIANPSERGAMMLSERVTVADQPLDATSCGLLEQRDGQLERHLRLLGVRIPVRTRHKEREGAGSTGSARSYSIQQQRGSGRPMRER